MKKTRIFPYPWACVSHKKQALRKKFGMRKLSHFPNKLVIYVILVLNLYLCLVFLNLCLMSFKFPILYVLCAACLVSFVSLVLYVSCPLCLVACLFHVRYTSCPMCLLSFMSCNLCVSCPVSMARVLFSASLCLCSMCLVSSFFVSCVSTYRMSRIQCS